MPNPTQMLIELALQEDIGSGDITTQALFSDEIQSRKAVFLAKEEMVLSGLDVAQKVFHTVDHHLEWQSQVKDGDLIPVGSTIASITGRYTSLLRAERTALNFLQHLSGIATLTHQFVKKLEGLPTKVLDTRKTTPAYRLLEKKAVKDGGGVNHRQGLYDQFLIKDNHLAGRSITEAVTLAKAYGDQPIILEVTSLEQIEEAISTGIHRLLLDNFSVTDLRKAVQLINGRVKTEASGGVRLESVRQIAETGVDFVSVGALTHSARAVDISMEIA